jgi:transcriptional antiterminator NusG
MDDDRDRMMEETLTEAGERLAADADSARSPNAAGSPSNGRAADALPDDAESNRSDDTALEDIQTEPAGTVEGSIDAEEEAEDEAVVDAVEESDEVESLEESEADAEPLTATNEEDATAVAPPAKAPAKKKAPEPEPEPEEIRMDWYILKVQSNRERSISEALERKMRIEGLDRYFDQVIVPTEKVTEFKGGKKKVVERKLYPGYIVVHMHINDDTWFAVRETSGVGDFTGAGGKPTPMLPHEVARIIQTEEEETSEAPKLDIRFSAGDKVKVKEGNFENFEGEVSTIDEASGRVVVMINIFGRSTPVELEYWQIELV